MIATNEALDAALNELESRFPGMGIMLSVFDHQDGETVANRDDRQVSAVIEGLYRNRVQVPSTKDTIQ